MNKLVLRAASVALAALVSACAPNDPKEEPTPPSASVATSPRGPARPTVALPMPSEGPQIAVLVVEAKGGVLDVLSATRVAKRDLGVAATFNGAGRPTHRWILRGTDGEERASGPIAVRRGVHVPENRSEGAPAAHADRASSAFVVRAPFPAEGERIEVVSTVNAAEKTEWRP